MITKSRPTLSLNPASWPISTKVVAVILAVSLAPMLLTAYYNTSGSLEALRDIELRSQRHHQEIISVALGEHKVKGRTEPVVIHAIKGVNAVPVADIALLPASVRPTVS